MKYRFRPSGKKRSLILKRGTTLRYSGRDKPQPVRALFDAKEKIFFTDDLPKRKKSFDLTKLRRTAKAFALKLSLFFRKLFGKLRTGIKKLNKGVTVFFDSRKKREKKEKKINSLPMLSGALVASLLVCAVSFIYIIFGLFSFYARDYETVTVPTLVGSQLSDAQVDGEKFNLTVKYENNPDYADGTVILQSPPSGVTRRIYKDDGKCDITLTVSKHEEIFVPDGLVGSSLRDASLSVLNNSLTYNVKEVYSETVEKGKVIGVSPASGTKASSNDTVTLTVSLGKRIKQIFVPSLIGASETDAINRLSAVGLKLGKVTYSHSDKSAGTVIYQSISKNTSVAEGTAVSITVSIGISG